MQILRLRESTSDGFLVDLVNAKQFPHTFKVSNTDEQTTENENTVNKREKAHLVLPATVCRSKYVLLNSQITYPPFGKYRTQVRDNDLASNRG